MSDQGTHIHVYEHVQYMCVYVCVYVCVCVCVSACVCACICIWMWICVMVFDNVPNSELSVSSDACLWALCLLLL